MKPLIAAMIVLMASVSYSQVLPDPEPVKLAQDIKLDQVAHLQSATIAVYKGANIVGSGFILFNNGDICLAITAAHVVDHLVKETKKGRYWMPCVVGRVDKEFASKRSLARVLKFDAKQDIAILSVLEGDKFPKAMTFRKDNPRLGQVVWHCGNPRGLLWGSVSTGIISFYNRGIRAEGDVAVFDQFNAPAVAGCSGGPVVILDEDGPKIIGIMTRYIRTPTTAAKVGEEEHVHAAAHSTMSLMVPTRQLRKFLEEHELEWALTGEKAPAFKDLDKLQPAKGDKFLPFLIFGGNHGRRRR